MFLTGKILCFSVLFVFTITSGAPRPQNDQIFFPDTDLEDRYFDPPNNNQNQNRPNRPDRLPNLNQWFTNPSRPSSTRPPFRRTTQRPVIPSAIGPRPSRCETSCLTTPEYNPVCGSDSVTYNNLGRLRCAAGCGKSKNNIRTRIFLIGQFNQNGSFPLGG